MTTQNINNTLLALLLALKDSNASLSETEKSDLNLAAEQLAANPKAWEGLIEPCLLKIVQANEDLNQSFQAIKSRLDNLGENIPVNLLPTEIELDQAVPLPPTEIELDQAVPLPPTEIELDQAVPLPEIHVMCRAVLQVSPSDLKSNEITNMAIRVLSTPNPAETTQKLSRFEQFQQFLNHQISGM